MENQEIRQIVQILETLPPTFAEALLRELRQKQFEIWNRMRQRDNFFGLLGRRPTGFVRAKV